MIHQWRSRLFGRGLFELDKFSRGNPIAKYWNSQSKSELKTRFSFIIGREFHLTNRHKINPLFAFIFKANAVKFLKGASIVFGRSFRKLHDKLPEHIRDQLQRHKIVFSSLVVLTPAIGYYSYVHYDTCPITGRKRWITFTREQVNALSDLDYQKLMDDYKNKLIDESHPIYQKNKQLVLQLVQGNSDIDTVKNTNWNLHVIDDPTITNAFVLPNGQIFVFTGMLKMLNTWEEMAVILGHEMSHAILGHSQEQQSFLAFGEILVIPVLAFIWFYFEDFLAFLIYSIQQYIYPLLFEYGFNLPYGRKLETEADEVGLLLAAKACFDPRWSVLFWQKMAMKDALEGNVDSDDFDFLSTHPGNQKRSAFLEEKLPAVLEIRKKCNCPPLPNIDPESVAHHMQKCVQNIKERKALMEELNQTKSILNQQNNIESDNQEPQHSENFVKMKKNSEKIETRLLELEDEYNKLTNVPEKPQAKNEEKDSKGKLGPLATAWYKVMDNMFTTGKLTDTLFETENSKLFTVNINKSAIGKPCVVPKDNLLLEK